MQHIIEREKFETIKFEKIIASEVSTIRGLSKRLKMYVEVDHFKNYIAASYKVTFKNYVNRKCNADTWTPTVTEWEFNTIDLAVDKYNKL